MTQLAETVTAEDELWTLDALPSTQYVAVEDETVEVRAPFPSQTYTLTGETLPPRIRVRRGVGGTTAAGHNSGSTLTPVYGLGAGEGAGAIAVDNLVDAPAEVTTIIAAGAEIVGDEATLRGKDFYAQDSDPGAVGIGSIWADTSFAPAARYWERADDNASWVARFSPTTQAVDDALASVSVVAVTPGTGNATADSTANATGDGNADAQIAAIVGGTGTATASVGAYSGMGSAAVLAIADAVSARLGFFDATPVARPVVPLTTPDAQDVIDALVALGLITQSD